MSATSVHTEVDAAYVVVQVSLSPPVVARSVSFADTLRFSSTGISDAYYCAECTRLEKDRDGCPKIVNLGASRTDMFYERKKNTQFQKG